MSYGLRGEVPSRNAFHWHSQCSLPDACLCLVLDVAGVGVCWGRAGQLAQGSGEQGRRMRQCYRARGKKSWDFSLLFSHLQKSVTAQPEILPAV